MVEEMKNGNENINESLVAEQMADTQIEKAAEQMPDMAEEAKKVLEKAEANETSLSDETKEKVKKVGFFAKLFAGSPEKQARKNTEAIAEIEAHPQLAANYEEAKELGRGELFVEAYRKLGTPFYWNADEGRYQGQPWNSK